MRLFEFVENETKLLNVGSSPIEISTIESGRVGPNVFMTGGVHGDELHGPIIVERLYNLVRARGLVKGTIYFIPFMNPRATKAKKRGYKNQDLNRSFPAQGKSPTDYIADYFQKNIIPNCDAGIDFHSGNPYVRLAEHIRIDYTYDAAVNIAAACGTLVTNEPHSGGTLRHYAATKGVPVMTYEGGKGLEIDPNILKSGVRVGLNFLNHFGMINTSYSTRSTMLPKSISINTPIAGSLKLYKKAGDYVEEGELLATVDNREIRAYDTGYVISCLETDDVFASQEIFEIGIPDMSL